MGLASMNLPNPLSKPVNVDTSCSSEFHKSGISKPVQPVDILEFFGAFGDCFKSDAS